MSPELRVLLKCAGADEAATGALAPLLASVTDWPLLLQSADDHGVTLLISAALAASRDEAAPPAISARLAQARLDGAKSALLFASELLALRDAFGAAGLEALPLKGPVLAEALYADPAARPFFDLDLLVREARVEEALRVLKSRGYVLAPHLARLSIKSLVAWDCEVRLRGPLGLDVDLQWRIAPRHFPFAFDADLMWRHTAQQPLAGQMIVAPTLEAQLLYLCVHGAKHRWSRLIWLADIARLLSRAPDGSISVALAEEAGAVRPLLLGLWLANNVLAAAAPLDLLARAESDRLIMQSAEKAKTRLLALPPEEPGSLELTGFNARLAEKPWLKLLHYTALMRAPTEADLLVATLPPALWGLYYPIRFARLATRGLAGAIGQR